MKELTIEEKAKRYDDAIERAKLSRAQLLDIGEEATEIEHIFPELKESEDEKIRKAIHIYLDWLDGRKDYAPKGEYSIRDMIAWLEKQGERKTPQWMIDFLDNYRRKIGCSLDYDEDKEVDGKILCIKEWLEKQGEQKPVIIPKFRVGDLIKEKKDKYGDSTIKIESIDAENYYYFGKDFPIRISEQDNWELVEQNPADRVEPKFKVGDIIKYVGEREEFSKEKHTIKKILDDCYLTIDDMYIPFKFEEYYIPIIQNQSWSEEDERILVRIQDHLRELYVDKKGYPYVAEPDSPEMIEMNWLNSIKDKVQPQPKQEWSEEDEKKRELLINVLKVNHPNGYFKVNPANTLNMEAMSAEELINWLESLRIAS